jgi:hypothetical protein
MRMLCQGEEQVGATGSVIGGKGRGTPTSVAGLQHAECHWHTTQRRGYTVLIESYSAPAEGLSQRGDQ